MELRWKLVEQHLRQSAFDFSPGFKGSGDEQSLKLQSEFFSVCVLLHSKFEETLETIIT